MPALLAAALLITTSLSQAKAAIFTVKPGSIFYSKPEKSEKYRLDLPEVRVQVPPLRDAKGFCLFDLVYKISDRDNPNLPKSGWARCVSTDTFISQ